MPEKEYCPNDELFETRVQVDSGRHLLQCVRCKRVSRTPRKHQMPNKNTASHDATMDTLWAYAIPINEENHVSTTHRNDTTDFNSAAASLREMIDAAAATVRAWDGHPKGILDGDFDTHEFVNGQVQLIHELSVQPWHLWDREVSTDWIRAAIKQKVFG